MFVWKTEFDNVLLFAIGVSQQRVVTIAVSVIDQIEVFLRGGGGNEIGQTVALMSVSTSVSTRVRLPEISTQSCSRTREKIGKRPGRTYSKCSPPLPPPTHTRHTYDKEQMGKEPGRKYSQCWPCRHVQPRCRPHLAPTVVDTVAHPASRAAPARMIGRARACACVCVRVCVHVRAHALSFERAGVCAHMRAFIRVFSNTLVCTHAHARPHTHAHTHLVSGLK